MRDLYNRDLNIRRADNAHSPYKFELRRIRNSGIPSEPIRRKPRWPKYLIGGIFILWLLSIFGVPAITTLIVLGLALVLFRPCSRASFGNHRASHFPENGSSNRPAVLAQPPSPEQVDKAIRNAGGIINYINYRKWE